jgi:hypothetical protein
MKAEGAVQGASRKEQLAIGNVQWKIFGEGRWLKAKDAGCCRSGAARQRLLV